MTSERPEAILGSSYLRMQSAPSTPSGVSDLSPSLCTNLSAFKSLMANYRKLDDSVVLRLNRAHAMAQRDPTRPYSEVSPSECQQFWSELLAAWKGREQAIGYCVAVNDAVLDSKRKAILGTTLGSQSASRQDSKLDADQAARDRLYTEEVRRQQIAREKDVEAIVRRRTLAVFLSKCKAVIPNESLDSSAMGVDDVHPSLLHAPA